MKKNKNKKHLRNWSKCTDEKGAFQSWIPWFICIAIGFHHHSDEISSELSSGDVSVIQHLYRCGWTGKGKQKTLSSSLPFISVQLAEGRKQQSRASVVAKGRTLKQVDMQIYGLRGKRISMRGQWEAVNILTFGFICVR